MKKHRVLLGGLLSLVTLVVGALWLVNESYSQKEEGKDVSSKKTARLPDRSRYPVVDYEAPLSADAERIQIGRRYDFKFEWVNPSPAPEVTWIGRSGKLVPISAAVPKEANLVVIGQILSSAAFLTEGKRNVYSEFVIRVNEVLGRQIVATPGQSIRADRLGGRVRYKTGQEVAYEVSGHDMPISGKEHLFFLQKDSSSPNYLLITAYELQEDDNIEPIDNSPVASEIRSLGKRLFLNDVREKVGRRPNQ